MKTIKRALAAFLLAALLTTLGCAPFTPEEATDENATRVAELEAELQQVKEEKYANEQAYHQEIATLKEEIERLSTAIKQPSPDKGASLIFHYKLENGAATITGYEGSAALVQIPAMLDGHPVKKIGERAFEGNEALAAVVVPEGVTEIDWFAFYSCAALQEISLPTSVALIGHAVFDGCPDLTVVCAAGSYAEGYARSYGITVMNQ
ncbi:MAG: hypothetical protein E7650_07955 [Ruminococcaceae bacterium]|nr:hypothetical protein [Oscillospiraceae bacterium]